MVIDISIYNGLRSIKLGIYLFSCALLYTSSYMLVFSDIKTCSGFKILKLHAEIPMSSSTWQDYFYVPLVIKFRYYEISDKQNGAHAPLLRKNMCTAHIFSLTALRYLHKGNGVHKSGQVITGCPQKWTTHNKQTRTSVH